MPKFPEPPPVAELEKLAPEVKGLPRGTVLWRIYFRGGSHPTLWSQFRQFGPLNARFDHQFSDADGNPCMQQRKILYAAENGLTCLAEVFQDTRAIDRRARDPWLVAFRLHRALHLLDLTGSWPTRAGASMAINSGPRPRARRWSQAIYAVYPDLHGIYYPSSMHANRPVAALYERAEAVGALPEQPVFHRSLTDPSLLTVLRNAALDLGYVLM